MTANTTADATVTDLTADEVLNQKLRDAMIPGFVVEFDPDEAERAGAFVEDALTADEALEGALDLNDPERS